MLFNKITTKMKNLLDTRTGQIMISIILGLGLAALFKKSCEGGKCIVFQAPSKDITKNIYKQDSKCMKFKSEATKCNKEAI